MTLDLFKHPYSHAGFWLCIGLGLMITLSLVRSFFYIREKSIDGFKDTTNIDDIDKPGARSISDKNCISEEGSENK